MRKDTTPLDLFYAEIQSLPGNVPTKKVWNSFRYVMNDVINQIKNLQTAVMGDGNGEDGLIARTERNEGSINDINTKLNRILEIIDEEKKEDKTPERTWFIQKVLPGLVQNLITGLFTALVSALIFIEVLKRYSGLMIK